MRLPLGATCNDCAHGKRCVELGYSWPERTQCDFYPNKFWPKAAQGEPMSNQRWWKCDHRECFYDKPIQRSEPPPEPYTPDHHWIECDANGDPLTAAPPIGEVFASMQTTFPQQPSGSAYSIEEHMFNQDEIQKRHPQQRSEAVTEKKRCCCQCGKEMWCYISEEVQAAIAERDATIATLRARLAGIANYETDLEESSDVRNIKQMAEATHNGEMNMNEKPKQKLRPDGIPRRCDTLLSHKAELAIREAVRVCEATLPAHEWETEAVVLLGQALDKVGDLVDMLADESEASARLSAAAPDLLESLQRMLTMYAPVNEGDDPWWDDANGRVCASAREAIRKAIGGAK